MVRSRSLLLLAALLVGCVPMPMAAPPQVAFTENDVPPIERLGRWDGSDFVPVEPGSIAPARTHVIVHGWAPGWYRDGRAPTEPAWAATLDGQPFDPWMRALAEALAARDPHAIVVVYSWIDDSATASNLLAQRRAYSRTEQHGRRLARAIEAALHPRFGDRGGQLVGHSFGARVATIAATELARPPRHLTLLDAPDAGIVTMLNTHADLPRWLRRLPIGTGDGETFVDNYISAMGTTYRWNDGLEEVVDVQTTPPNGLLDVSPRHVWAAEFYAQTADRPFGIGWSPLLAGSPPRGCFRRPYDAIALERRCGS